jgi:hypothetical protein
MVSSQSQGRWEQGPKKRACLPGIADSLQVPARHMPTIKVIGPYRFHFYSSDSAEPMHVHVERDAATAKFWLNPVRLERSHGFARAELARLQKLVERHQVEFRRKWNDYFGAE